MQLFVDIPTYLPDATQCTPQQFMQDAKLAMAIKLFEMNRLSSGMAASLIGITHVKFLGELHRFGVPMIDLDENELVQDILRETEIAKIPIDISSCSAGKPAPTENAETSVVGAGLPTLEPIL